VEWIILLSGAVARAGWKGIKPELLELRLYEWERLQVLSLIHLRSLSIISSSVTHGRAGSAPQQNFERALRFLQDTASQHSTGKHDDFPSLPPSLCVFVKLCAGGTRQTAVIVHISRRAQTCGRQSTPTHRPKLILRAIIEVAEIRSNFHMSLNREHGRSGFDGLSVTPCFREHLHSSGRRTGHRWDRLTETRSVLLHRLSASRVCLSMLLDPSLSGRAQLCMRRPLLCWEAACAALMRRPHQVVSERLGRTGRVVFPPDGNAVVHNTANSFIKPGFKGTESTSFLSHSSEEQTIFGFDKVLSGTSPPIIWRGPRIKQADVCRVAPSSCVAHRYTDTAEKQTRTDGEEREESPSAAAAAFKQRCGDMTGDECVATGRSSRLKTRRDVKERQVLKRHVDLSFSPDPLKLRQKQTGVDTDGETQEEVTTF
ncbi:hypothetical protein DPX16_14352, partial [Anabarilius grahami]